MPQEKTAARRLYLADIAEMAGMTPKALEHYLSASRARARAEAAARQPSGRNGDDFPLPSGREKDRGRLYWADPGPARAWAERKIRLREAGGPDPGGRLRLYTEDVAWLLGVTPDTVLTYRARAAQRARARADGRPWAHQSGDDLPPPDGKSPARYRRLWWYYETLLPFLRGRRGAGRPRTVTVPPPPDSGTARRVLHLLAEDAKADPSAPWPDLARLAAAELSARQHPPDGGDHG